MRTGILHRLRYMHTALCIFAVLCTSLAAWSSETAPNWHIKTGKGNYVSLQEEIENGKKVVLIFWASWSQHCEKLLPKLKELHSQLNPEEFTIVAMKIWQAGSEEEAAFDLPFPHIRNADAIAQKYQVKATPGVFVIGEERKVLYRNKPGTSVEQLILQLRQSLSL